MFYLINLKDFCKYMLILIPVYCFRQVGAEAWKKDWESCGIAQKHLFEHFHW